MTFEEFKAFVGRHAHLFGGAPREVEGSIEQAEARLGFRLPETLRWLLREHGYAEAAGVDSLAMSVEATLRCRRALSLPNKYIVLNDWGDVGVVVMDASGDDPESWPVYWSGSHNVNRLAEGEPLDNDCDAYPGYVAWALSRIESSLENT
ncbi:MAG TPA: SMI1/KNR4 family protein [Vicinamibacterales bacterium]|nr:SMI1/KNR4 family protein [Vicinamibacterales bacterium]